MTDDAAASGAVLWKPDGTAADHSAMGCLLAAVAAEHNLPSSDYEVVWQWSVGRPDLFWPRLADFFDVRATGNWSPWRDERTDLSGAGWFPNLQLNYVENIFARAGDGPALVVLHEDADPRPVSWADLRAQVAALAARLRAWGVQPGDRVGAFLPNRAEAVVGLLASAAVGAVWACCAPDYGVDAVVDRLDQVAPRVLLVADGYRYGGRWIDRRHAIAEIAGRLPSVEHVLWVGESEPVVPADLWNEVTAGAAELETARLPFDHPLWILYSSGTTGLPKGIVHSHGGILLEHLKWWGLHNDVRAGDVFFWFTSTAWMVWNAAVSTLLTGATLVLYDGSPTYPGIDALWRIAARTGVTHLGTSAGYLTANQRAGAHPGRDHDLGTLRCVMSSGSVLPLDAWRWVYSEVKPDIWLDAPSGGTDVCTPYVGANPILPVYAGEMQCRFLGTHVEAWREDGTAVRDEVGELVVTAPMPSMPLCFWNDPDGTRLREAYFDHFPGIWRHGDWIAITSRGTAIIHGRSDSTINRHGVRIGSADIYAAVERIPEIEDALVIGAELAEGAYWMPLFVKLTDRVDLDDALRERISSVIRTTCSVRHVPDEILAVPAIPHTLTGKRLEVPVKRLLQGVPLERAVNPGVVDFPEVLAHFVELGRLRRESQGALR